MYYVLGELDWHVELKNNQHQDIATRCAPPRQASYRANDVGIGPTFSLSILECRPVSFLNMQFSPGGDENHIQEKLYVFARL